MACTGFIWLLTGTPSKDIGKIGRLTANIIRATWSQVHIQLYLNIFGSAIFIINLFLQEEVADYGIDPHGHIPTLVENNAAVMIPQTVPPQLLADQVILPPTF